MSTPFATLTEKRSPAPSGPAHGAQRVRCIGCPVWQHSADCEFERLTLEPREAFPEHYEHASGFALVRRGLVIRQRTDERGRRIAVDLVGPGQGFRLGGGGYAVDRTLLCVRTAAPEQMAELVSNVSGALLTSIERMERLMVARSKPTAEARVTSLLAELGPLLGEERVDHVPPELLQQDMAALLAMRHESVCRALRGLRENGTIDRDSDGIHILTGSALRGHGLDA